MKYLNIANLATLVRNETNLTSDKEVLENLFNATIYSLGITNKEGEFVDISKSDASQLMNHKANVKRPLQTLPTEKQLPDVIDQMEKQIISCISLDKASDLKTKLIDLIKSDPKLPAKKRKELEDKSSGSLTEFLTYVYLATLQIPNKLPNYKGTPISEVIDKEFPNRKIGYASYYSLIISDNDIVNPLKSGNTEKMTISSTRLPGYKNPEIKNLLNEDPNRVFKIPAIVGCETLKMDDKLYLARITDFTSQDGSMIIEYEKIVPINREILLDRDIYHSSSLAKSIGINNLDLVRTHWIVKKFDLTQNLEDSGY